MPVGNDEFRRALGSFASGVTVVTNIGSDGVARGLTVSAFSSVSLEPPLILVCIDLKASIHSHLVEGANFAVNILSEEQEALSRTFASRESDRFVGLRIRKGLTGAPIIEDCLASLECRVVHLHEGGDHTIFVGEVLATGVSDGRPLLYFRSGYARLSEEQR